MVIYFPSMLVTLLSGFLSPSQVAWGKLSEVGGRVLGPTSSLWMVLPSCSVTLSCRLCRHAFLPCFLPPPCLSVPAFSTLLCSSLSCSSLVSCHLILLYLRLFLTCFGVTPSLSISPAFLTLIMIPSSRAVIIHLTILSYSSLCTIPPSCPANLSPPPVLPVLINCPIVLHHAHHPVLPCPALLSYFK